MFASLASALRLRLVNTGQVHSYNDTITHHPWNGSDPTQIGYLLLPVSLFVEPTFAMDLPCGTDHRAICAPVVMPGSTLSKQGSSKFAPKNWYLPAVPRVQCNEHDESAFLFNEELNTKMSEVEHLQGPIPLDDFSHILAETSLKHGSTWRHQTANPYKAELCALERSRRTSSDVEHRKIKTKEIWKLRRQTRRKRGQDLLDQFTRQGKTRQWKQMSAPRVLPPSLDGEGDRTAWSGLLSEHFKQVFSHSSVADDAWRVDLKHRLDVAYEDWRRSPSLSVVFTLEDVRSAVHKLKRGKTTASDQCSAEMFHALDDSVLMKLAVSLSVRASGGMPTPPPPGRLFMPFCLRRYQILRQAVTFAG